MPEQEDRLAMIVTLQRLAAQTRNAITYLQSGGPLMPCCNPTITVPKPIGFGTPGYIQIGDFIIRDRFVAPHLSHEPKDSQTPSEIQPGCPPKPQGS